MQHRQKRLPVLMLDRAGHDWSIEGPLRLNHAALDAVASGDQVVIDQQVGARSDDDSIPGDRSWLPAVSRCTESYGRADEHERAAKELSHGGHSPFGGTLSLQAT
jgi:hypothetical protein